MADLTPQVAKAMARYWPAIQSATRQGLGTSDLFATLRQHAQDIGLSSLGVQASAISVLRGYAARMQRAANVFNGADGGQAITGAMIAEAPYARPLAEQNTMPVYNVTFNHQIQLDDGSIVNKWQTMTVTSVLPSTVGDLTSAVTSEAQILAAEGGDIASGTPHGTSLGVSDLMIVAV